MKKFMPHVTAGLSNALLVFSMALLLLLSCSKDDAGKSGYDRSRATRGMGKSSALNSLTETSHSISVDDARSFIKNYYDKTVAGLNDEEKKKMVTSVYFPLDALENYIAAMKTYNEKTSGIRVYFARYSKSHMNNLELTDRVLQLDHQDLNTVIFVATAKNPEGYPVDIIGSGLNQPFNAGVSCPPLPSSYCKGLYCPLVEN